MADVCWECGVCKAVFRSRDAWSSHSCNHSSSRPGTALLQHGVVITPGPAIPGTLTTSLAFQCDLCHKVLRDEHTLKCHAKTVHGEKKFSCNTCGKKFPHKGVLNAHKKTHSNLLLTCSVCQESFKDSSYFKKHVRAHAGSRPHACKTCGKSYLQYSHLKVHMSLHTKDKAFECNICQKTFRLSKSFREHQNMHQNIKNFKCSHCSYSTCFRKNLHAHLKNHERKQEALKESKFKINAERKKTDENDNNNTKCIPDIKIEKTVSTRVSVGQGNSAVTVADEPNAPVFLYVNVAEGQASLREQIFSIEDIETLDPLEMAQELSITTQPHTYAEKLRCDEYRPLDLSVVPLRCTTDKLNLDIKTDGAYFNETEGPSEYTDTDSGFSAASSARFPVFTGAEFGDRRSGESSPVLNGGFPDFTVDNSGRRRSVFLAEQLEYEHQGEMRVVDPAEVTR